MCVSGQMFNIKLQHWACDTPVHPGHSNGDRTFRTIRAFVEINTNGFCTERTILSSDHWGSRCVGWHTHDAAARDSSVNKWHFLIKSIIVEHRRSKEVFHQSPSVIGRKCRNTPWLGWQSIAAALVHFNKGWLDMMKLLLFITPPVCGYWLSVHVDMLSYFQLITDSSWQI